MRKHLLVATLAAVSSVAMAQTTTVLDDGLDTSASFVVRRTKDTIAAFGNNWSATSVPAGTGYTTVPGSPNSSSTVGLRLEVNNNNADGDALAQRAGVTVWATTAPSTNNYDVNVWVFGAYPAPLNGGGTGSTEEFGLIVQNSNITSVAATRIGALTSVANPTDVSAAIDFSSSQTATAQLQDGLVFALNFDEGNGVGTVASPQSQIWLYDRTQTTSGTAFNNGFVGNWTAGLGTPNGYYSFENTVDLPTTPPFPPAGSYISAITYPPGRAVADQIGIGFVWTKITAKVRTANVTFLVNDAPIVSVANTKAGKNVGITFLDSFTSVSPSDSYALVDRVLIQDVVPSTAASDWQLFN